MSQTLDVIWVAVRAILQVFITTGVGAVLAHMGHLGRETLTSLGRISYFVLIPCMAFYKICVGVRLEQLLDAWPFLIYPTLFALGGLGVGAALTRLLKIESKPLRHSIVVTLMFGNYGNLPFSLLETITKDVSPFSEDPISMQRSLAYASIFLSTASLWLWSFGPWYIKKSRSDPDQSSDSDSSVEVEAPPLKSPAEEISSNAKSTEDEEASVPLEEFQSSESIILGEVTGESNGIEAFQPRVPFRQRIAARAAASIKFVHNLPIWTIITPSTIACILAVLLLAISPVHRLMFTPVPLVTSTPDTPAAETATGKPPLQFIADAIGGLANVCVPVSLLLLGSNLYSTVKTQWARSRLQRDSGPTQNQSILPLPKRVLFGAVFARLVLLPAIFFCITGLFSKVGVLPADPLITVILIIEGCMPSAINLIILAQLQDDQLVVEQLSTILLFQYLFCTFSMFTTIAMGIKLFL
jgi:predicted permease